MFLHRPGSQLNHLLQPQEKHPPDVTLKSLVLLLTTIGYSA